MTFTFTAEADDDDDDGESVLLSFGASLPADVTAGDAGHEHRHLQRRGCTVHHGDLRERHVSPWRRATTRGPPR